ncbi:MAG: hypothetical protein ACREGD_01445 [Candidatus Saccharimonadales bacterium]
MEPLIKALRRDFPHVTFVRGEQPYWSPKTKEVYFCTDGGDEKALGVLHEVGHALLGHTNYNTDIDLLEKEALAWAEARKLATRYKIQINGAHIEDCLDTYREWIYRRSTCPVCSLNGVERSTRHYYCINCTENWTVGLSRFCRPYRK